MIPDVTGLDVYPILAEAAAEYAIPLALLLACAKAESGMDPTAFRDGVWPDVSCGPFQQTVAYAPIGNGTDHPDNIALCRSRFTDWGLSTSVAAQSLESGYRNAYNAGYDGDDQIIAALSQYNAGSIQPPGNWWWQSGNCASYRSALAWAKKELGE